MKRRCCRSQRIALTMIAFVSALTAQDISWEKLNGPFGGTTLSFVASPTGGGVFAGSDINEGGVYRSTDDGLLWTRVSTGIALTDRSITWLTVDDTGNVIAGTGSHIGSRVYKSTDNGGHWSKIADLGGTSCVKSDSGHLYVGDTGYAQYSVSKDGGYSWVPYSHPSPFINCIAIDDSGYLFVGGNYTGYRSTDNGARWNTMSLPDGITSITCAAGGLMFAGCSRDDVANAGIYRSTDRGASWVLAKGGVRISRSQNIVITNSGTILAGTCGWGIWRSTDQGVSWTQHNSGLGHFYVRAMFTTANGIVYAGLSGGGVYRSSDDGITWEQTGIAVATARRLAFHPGSKSIFASVSGVSRSTDRGVSWHPVNSGLVSYDSRAFLVHGDGTVVVSFGDNSYGTVYYSETNGDSWIRRDGGLSNHGVDALAIDQAGTIFAANYDGVHASPDSGKSWTTTGPSGHDFKPAGLAFNSRGDLFLASGSSGVWRLKKDSTVWMQVHTSPRYSLLCASNDYLYSGRYRSTDGGDTWTAMSVDHFPSAFVENSQGHLFCGSFNYGSGVWRSTDLGSSWHQVNTGLPTMDIRSLAIDEDDFLYAGTYRESVYKTSTATTTSIPENRSVPSSFRLEQNYPNPFNPATIIRYSLPSSQHVSLKVFDLLGREVATLVNEFMPSGEHHATFHAKGISSGMYVYRLTAGYHTQSHTMIFLQ